MNIVQVCNDFNINENDIYHVSEKNTLNMKIN
jgi:hypothetical protein